MSSWSGTFRCEICPRTTPAQRPGGSTRDLRLSTTTVEPAEDLPGPLKRFDTDYGLVGMGGSPSQVVQGIETQQRFSSHVCAGSGPTQPKETMMRFFTQAHRLYSGLDLHTSPLP